MTSGEDTPVNISPRSANWLRRNRRYVGAIAAGVALAVATTHPHHQRGETKPKPAPAAKAPKPTHVQPNTHTVYATTTGVQKLIHNYDATGYAANVFKPDADSKAYYKSQFLNDNGLPFARFPKLKETDYLRDSKAFPGKLGKKPYALEIYNATKRPVDMEFVRFTAEATKHWLDQHKKSRLDFNNTFTADIKPINIPHQILLLPTMPKYVVNPDNPALAPRVPSLTNVPDTPLAGDVTTTWVNVNDKRYGAQEADQAHLPSALKEAYAANTMLATEVCQAMVNVDNVRVLPSGAPIIQHLEQFWNSNEPAVQDGYPIAPLGDVRLYGQEVVCNSMGRILTASYYGGLAPIQHRIDTHPLMQVAPSFNSQIADTTWLGALQDQIESHPGSLYAMPGTPTGDHYGA